MADTITTEDVALHAAGHDFEVRVYPVLIYPLVHADLPEADEELSATLAAMPPALRFPPLRPSAERAKGVLA